ncbi:hypothetical protein BGZ83_008333 [Gryganskiella cystojenkinii]|nr:hypothetical protein BGZ83_008333 [Gryganskiella cystojenkinii]
MLYHAIRLVCITYSSYKTWAAVVDPKDKGQARRHLFLWFVYLAGLALEPIVDSFVAYRLPVYEGIKIVITGWLLLAHYYLSRAAATPPKPTTLRRSESSLGRRETSFTRLEPSQSFTSTASIPSSKQQKFRSEDPIRRNPTAGTIPDSTTVSSLDFGRFKRDLERRRTGSVSSSAAPAVATSSSRIFSRQDSRDQFDREHHHHKHHPQDHPTLPQERILSRPLATSKSASTPPSWLQGRPESQQQQKQQYHHTDMLPMARSPVERTRSRLSVTTPIPSSPPEPVERRVSSSAQRDTIDRTEETTAAERPTARRRSGHARGDEDDIIEKTNPGRKRNFSEVQHANSVPQAPRLTYQQLLRQQNKLSLLRRRHITTATASNTRQSTTRDETDMTASRESKRTKPSPVDEVLRQPLRASELSSRVRDEEAEPAMRASSRSKDQGARVVERKSSSTQLPTKLAFSRPKPPGKHRASLVTHYTAPAAMTSAGRESSFQVSSSKDHSSLQRRKTDPTHSRSQSRQRQQETALLSPPNPPLHSASFESRMNNVHEWVHYRGNPPLASPPLTANSHDQQSTRKRNNAAGSNTPSPPELAHSLSAENSGRRQQRQQEQQQITKRRAHRQLTPKDLKRQAMMQQQEDEEEDLEPRQLHQRQRRRSITPPTDTADSSGAVAALGYDPKRDHPPSDSVSEYWSRFERSNRNDHASIKRSLSSGSSSTKAVAAASSSSSTVPLWKIPVKPSPHPNPFLTSREDEDEYDDQEVELEDDQEVNLALSPLVRLRQSQLRQRQQEDILGIRRRSEDSPEDSSKFKDALALWEAEDDETLARNAAREAAEDEEVAATMRKAPHPRESLLVGTSSALAGISSPRKIATPKRGVAPTPSLLQTIPFNGDSAQRPAPDLDFARVRSRNSVTGNISNNNALTEIGQDQVATLSTPIFRLHRRTPKKSSTSTNNYASPNTRRIISTNAAAAAAVARSSPYHAASNKSPSNRSQRMKDVLSVGTLPMNRKEEHPGLYTPSKSKTLAPGTLSGSIPSTPSRRKKESSFSFDGSSSNIPPQSPYKSTPTVMSRYIQLSNLSDEEQEESA